MLKLARSAVSIAEIKLLFKIKSLIFFILEKQCGRNEIEGYEGCDPTCDDLHSSRCTGHKKGCVCKYNYVRNSQGVCVPAENVCGECTSAWINYFEIRKGYFSS